MQNGKLSIRQDTRKSVPAQAAPAAGEPAPAS
jgi:hypothetical protein